MCIRDSHQLVVRDQRVVGVAEQPIDGLPFHVGLQRARHGIDGADQRVAEVDRFLRSRKVLRHRVHQAAAEAERLEPRFAGETPGVLPQRHRLLVGVRDDDIAQQAGCLLYTSRCV